MAPAASQDALSTPPEEKIPESTIPADFGDANAEFEALRSKCGFYKMPWRAKISLTGPDRVRWLNGVATNNVRDLPVSTGVYAFLLSPQGRILGDLYAYNRGEVLLLDMDHSQVQKITALFNRYIVMDEVEVNDVSGNLASIGITGPGVREILSMAEFEFPRLQPLELADLKWKDIPVSLVRSDAPAVESYEIWVGPGNEAPLIGAIKKAGAALVGATALNMLRIAEGIPKYGQDIRERDLPQETRQDRALHFSKGCYIGQEIVERIRSRGNVHRTFTGFRVEGPLPVPGAKIQIDGKDVGEITSSAKLPFNDRQSGVALGYIRREAALANEPIPLNDSILKVASLPFSELFKN